MSWIMANPIRVGDHFVAFGFLLQVCAWGYQTHRDLIQETEVYQQQAEAMMQKDFYVRSGLKLQ